MSLSHIGMVVDACLDQVRDHHRGVTVDCSVVMPNHVHAILFLDEGSVGLGVVVRTLKAAASRAAGRPLYERDLTRLREYVDTNPLRWALDRENPADG